MLDRPMDDGSDDRRANRYRNEEDHTADDASRLWGEAGEIREQATGHRSEPKGKKCTQHERADVDGLPDQSTSPTPYHQQHHQSENNEVDHEWMISRGFSGTCYKSSWSPSDSSVGIFTASISRVQNLR